MDADTRHQLKQNELAEALSKLGDLRDPKFLYTLIAVAVIGVGVLAWYGWRYTQRQALEQGWEQLGKVSASLSADDPAAVATAQTDLRTMIKESSSRKVVSYARLELARSLVEAGLLRPAERPTSFEEAVTVLTELRSDPEAPELISAPATFLLATAYESLRQFDKAKELYQSLSTEARYNGSPFQALAVERRADIDTLTARVAFTPGSPPAPTPPGAPTTAGAPMMIPGLKKIDPPITPSGAPVPQRAPVAQPTDAPPVETPPSPPPTPSPAEPPPAEPEHAPASPEPAPSPAP
jgi:predicted negative regulator of RcsB-dependent stress response